MPTYDYKCKRCKHEFDAFQSITSDALTKCPNCGRNALQRLIGPGAGLIFKGKGFYSTDYKKAAPEKADPAKVLAPEEKAPVAPKTDAKSSED
jgi:putative FmdB family regulatory protein